MRHGFTLLELSIVLTLIAVILGGGLVTFNASLQAKQFNTTVARMDAIDKAILNFSVAYGRIPCPSNNTATINGTYYGIEAANSGTCYGGTPAANYAPSSGTSAVEGGIPTRTLKLTDDYMYDGWGRRFGYAVDPTYTVSGSLPVSPSCAAIPSTTGVTVNDATATGGARTLAGTYALISHGANGHGAYTSAGVMLNASSTNTNELTNCHCTTAGVLNSYATPVNYVAMAPTIDSTTATDNFDDIVTFKEPWQLQAPNAQISAAATCPVFYVSDNSNNRIVEISGGSYISQLPVPSCTGNGACPNSHANGQYDPSDVQIDSAGNFWVVDQFANRLEKFGPTGSYILQVGCASGYCSGGLGTGVVGSTALFETPLFVTIDTNGNLWVSDNGNYRVEEISPSGNFMLGLGAGYNGVAGTIGHTGTAAGQFKQPGRVAVDLDHNIVYVPDTTNNNVQTYNATTGAYIGQLGGCGSGKCVTGLHGAGQYYGPNSVRIDSSGYIWVSEAFNSRVQKLNTSAVQISPYQIGCPITTLGVGQQCGWGGPGEFTQAPEDFAFDAYGNLWVTIFTNTIALYKLNSTSGAFLSSYALGSPSTAAWAYPEGIAMPPSSR